jgi:heme oxygenase
MTNIQKILKQKTATIHQRLEKDSILRHYLSDELTLDDYKDILKLQGIAYIYWQQQLSEFVAGWPVDDIFHLQLQADLITEELALASQEPIQNRPQALNLSSLAEYLGCAYVFEGSKLGSKLIYKQLLKNKNLDSHTFLYFKNLNEEKPRWANWLQQLELIITSEQIALSEISNAALQCFDIIYEYFAIDHIIFKHR